MNDFSYTRWHLEFPKGNRSEVCFKCFNIFCNTYFHPERTKTIYRFTVRLEKINKLFFASQWIGQPSSHCAILFCIWESLNQCSEACLSNPLNFLHQYQTYYLCVISLQPWKSSITQRIWESPSRNDTASFSHKNHPLKTARKLLHKRLPVLTAGPKRPVSCHAVESKAHTGGANASKATGANPS